MCLKFVRSGNKVVRLLAFGIVTMQQCRTLSVVTVESLTNLMNSRTRKRLCCRDYRALRPPGRKDGK
jgi:hypothetical protein